MRYAGGGVGHYQIPLHDTARESPELTRPDSNFDPATDTEEDEPVFRDTLTTEQLRQQAEAVGETLIENEQDHDHEIDEEQELMEENSGDDADIDIAEDESDLGAEDGEDGIEDDGDTL